MKTLVIGDLHGVHWVAQAALDTGLPVIFIGDYLDSFDKSRDDQLKTLDIVLTAARDREDVVALMGNHEMSYLSDRHQCSGFTNDFYTRLMSDFEPGVTYLQAMSRYLEPWAFDEGFLISHAGVSQRFLNENECTLEDALANPRLWDKIGSTRGLGAPPHCGGIFWCDWNHEFEPIDDVPQIVGHTRAKMAGQIQQKGNSYNIDCVAHNYNVAVVGCIDDGKFEPYHLYRDH